MTLDEFIQKYNGQYVRGGQCGELVRQYWIDVDKTNPPSYPNSVDYWHNPVPGYDKVQDRKPGDIAIYDGHVGYPEGHSAIVYDDTQVFQQNANPDGSPAHLFPRTNLRLLGYLRKQGGIMEPQDYRMNKGDVINGFKFLGIEPTQADFDIWIGETFKNFQYKKIFQYNLVQPGKADEQIKQIEDIING